jgi:hypothetical protein
VVFSSFKFLGASSERTSVSVSLFFQFVYRYLLLVLGSAVRSRREFFHLVYCVCARRVMDILFSNRLYDFHGVLFADLF